MPRSLAARSARPSMATATSAARRLARWPAVVQWTGSAHWANAADNSAPARTYDEVAATKTMRRTRQIATLCRLEGPQAAGMVGEGQIIVERAPASTGRVALVTGGQPLPPLRRLAQR